MAAAEGLLQPERGDLVLFANTSAEHPGTYEFAARCKERLEVEFGLPCLWLEFCTVEDAWRGEYRRKASYRLVKPVPIEVDPDGYRSSGELFEEFVSLQGILPNPHSRTCTAKLKLYPSHELLGEWLGRTAGPVVQVDRPRTDQTEAVDRVDYSVGMVQSIRRYARREKDARPPYKPSPLLSLIGRLANGQSAKVPFSEAERDLKLMQECRPDRNVRVVWPFVCLTNLRNCQQVEDSPRGDVTERVVAHGVTRHIARRDSRRLGVRVSGDDGACATRFNLKSASRERCCHPRAPARSRTNSVRPS